MLEGLVATSPFTSSDTGEGYEVCPSAVLAGLHTPLLEGSPFTLLWAQAFLSALTAALTSAAASLSSWATL